MTPTYLPDLGDVGTVNKGIQGEECQAFTLMVTIYIFFFISEILFFDNKIILQLVKQKTKKQKRR